MKRFGVQLAACGLVVLLGALGVAQAQRDTQKPDSNEWDAQPLPAMGPPVPIAADASASPTSAGFPAGASDASQSPSSFDAPSFQNAAFNFPATPPQAAGAANAPDTGPSGMALGAVRQVAHEDAFTLPPNTEPEPGYDVDESAAGPAGFALPAGLGSGMAAAAPAAMRSGEAAAQNSAPPAYGFAASQDAGDEDAGSGAPVYAGAAAPLNDAAAAEDAAAAGPGMFAGRAAPLAADPGPYAVAGAGSGGSAMPLSAGPINELRDPASLTTERAPNQDDTSPAGQYPSVNQYPLGDQYAGGSSDTAVAPSQAGAFAAPQPGAAMATAQPPAQGEHALPANGYGSQDLGAALGSNFPGPEATGGNSLNQPPAARVASVMPVPLGGLDAAALETVLNEPGDRRLEGMQSPSIVIQKRAPEQVKVGKPAAFVIHVHNVGGVEALGVQVHDRVPSGMRLIDASPQPQQQGDLLLWQLGALEPGGERTISMQLVPEQEGELGSVARVTFEAAASVRTISTRPALKITQRAPDRVLIGQQLEIELEVSNPGTGAATGVILQADVPEGLEHPKGRQLDNLIGTLAPGEVRRQVLRLRAVGPGMIENQIRLVGDDDLTAVDNVSIEVIAPQLAIELEGPARRFLERQATYQVSLANVGSAEATNVEIVAYLDRGFSFVGTEYQGQYDPTRHAVYWSLAELPAEGRGSVPLTLLPIEQGERAIRLEARGDLNVIARHEKRVSVDTLAELTFSITDDADPIEVGGTVTYEIRIANRGSGDDANVSLKLQLPPGLELVSSDNDASTDGQGLVVFAPQPVMAARSETVHRVRVRGKSPGTHLVKAVVSSGQSSVPVTKEESTTVYADQ